MSLSDMWRPRSAIIQVTTASISFIASVATATMIYHSDGKLSNPYRRIIFGLSTFDVAQSLGLLTGPFITNGELYHLPWSIGNVGTCEAGGVMLIAGSTATPLYTLLLCVYYLWKVKYSMSNEAFTNQMERKAHIIIFVLVFSVVTCALITKAINPNAGGTICHIIAYPQYCVSHPEINGECVRGQTSWLLFLVFSLLLSAVVFPLIIITSLMLYGHVMKRNNIFGAGQSERKELKPEIHEEEFILTRIPVNRDGSLEVSDAESPKSSCGKEHNSLTALDSNQDRRKHVGRSGGHQSDFQEQRYLKRRAGSAALARLYERETLIQASLYVIAFFGTHSLLGIIAILRVAGIQKDLNDFVALLYPLGGLFNILIFSRPKVALLRRNHSRFTWIQALWLVLREGGDLPSENELIRTSAWFSHCFMFQREPMILNTGTYPETKSASFPINNDCRFVFDTDVQNSPDKQYHESASPRLPRFSPPLEMAESEKVSLDAIHGLSQSFDSGAVGYRTVEKWRYLPGTSNEIE